MEYKGKEVLLYCLRNSAGMEVAVTNFGARIVKILVKDAQGVPRDVVLGFDGVEEYLPENNRTDFGALVGRYANRIAGGRMTIEGVEYELPLNDGPNCLHGGPGGWQDAVFDVVSYRPDRIEMRLVSPDGDNGFPGTVVATVAYTLGGDNSLRIDYHAATEKPTALNLTNHSYFNLNGLAEEGIGIGNHCLEIDADGYLPVDGNKIPLGAIATVEGTPMDFRRGAMLGERMACGEEPVASTGGYDHCWVLNRHGDLSRRAAAVRCPATGVEMEIFTTEPGIQVYTGNFLDGVRGKGGLAYNRHYAVCFETQQFPDSPNHCWLQSPGIQMPGKPYQSTTIFRFKSHCNGN